MKSTVSVFELNRILAMEHPSPNEVLGMHTVDTVEGRLLCVRAFFPEAKNVFILADEEAEEYKLARIHDEGFFEIVFGSGLAPFEYTLRIEEQNDALWETKDPYSFGPVTGELDRWLFGQGTNYRLAEKMGANIKTVNGIKGTLFTVWAPNAKGVGVLGSFNGWNARRHQLRRLEGGIWEIFAPGILPGNMYKFALIDSTGKYIEKTDPFGKAFELRPNTASIVTDTSDYKWEDRRWLSKRAKTDFSASPVNIYEVHLGSWQRSESGGFLDYQTLAERLCAYAKEQKYTHIELLPVMEHPLDASWGYQVTGYFAPTSRYGTPEDFKRFVDICHKNGVGVILDWVPAHFPRDSWALGRFDGTPVFEYADPKLGEHPEWGTYIFDFGKGEVKNFLISSALFWINEYHADGLRVDAVASMLYLDYAKKDGSAPVNKYGGNENLEAAEFIKHMNSVIRGQSPDVMIIAEESTSWPRVTESAEAGGLGFSFKWDLGFMNDFLFYMKKEPVYRSYHHNNLTFSMMYNYSEKFILPLSHDEVVHGKASLASKMPGGIEEKIRSLRLAYTFMFGHPGKKLLFMGGELGQFEEWDENGSLRWELLDFPVHSGLKKYTAALSALYKKRRELYELDCEPAGFSWIDPDDSARSIAAFARAGRDGKNSLIFVCNFNSVAYDEYALGVFEEGFYKEILNSDSMDFGGSGLYLNKKRLKSADLPCSKAPRRINIRLAPLSAAVFGLEKSK